MGHTGTGPYGSSNGGFNDTFSISNLIGGSKNDNGHKKVWLEGSEAGMEIAFDIILKGIENMRTSLTVKSEPKAVSYFAVAHDPENYETLESNDIVDAWKRLMYFDPQDNSLSSQREADAFKEFADNPDNWHTDPDGKPCMLVWNVGGESSGAITFYRTTHS